MTSLDDQPLDGTAERPSPEFAQFYATAFPLLVGRVFLIVGHSHLAEDLAQDAMVEMFHQWSDRSDRSVKDNIAWAVGIAANLTRRHQRRLVTGARAVARWAGMHRPATVYIEMDVLVRSEAYRRIAGLSKRQRAVAVLWVFADMTAEEIAQTLGIATSTVRTHLQRIRKHLVDHMDSEIVVGDQRSIRPREFQL